YYLCISFFFQAEDGIRDRNVTGVQTCALPILPILYGAAFIAFVGGGIQYFYAGTQRKAIENMLFTGKKNDMLSPKERSKIEQLIEEERTLTLQLSDIDNAMRQNNLLEIQAEEQQQILDKRYVQLDDRIESERFMRSEER